MSLSSVSGKRVTSLGRLNQRSVSHVSGARYHSPMRASILAIGFLSLYFVGCGSGDGDPCPVFALNASDGVLYDTQTEQRMEFTGSCTNPIDGKKYRGIEENMTLYLDGRALPRDKWLVGDSHSIVILGTYKTTEHDFSVSYGCTARKLVDTMIGCGYENAEIADVQISR